MLSEGEALGEDRGPATWWKEREARRKEPESLCPSECPAAALPFREAFLNFPSPASGHRMLSGFLLVVALQVSKL